MGDAFAVEYPSVSQRRRGGTMYKNDDMNKSRSKSSERNTKSSDRSDMHRFDRSDDMRKANDNVRKSQGEDAGNRPSIDRHR
jgi:hypothetical protein